jgi:hypothetical protein
LHAETLVRAGRLASRARLQLPSPTAGATQEM